MPLTLVLAALDAELNALVTHFRDFAANKGVPTSATHFALEDEALLEGLLSKVWQSWCSFCRSCVIESCMGTTTASGGPVHRLPQASSVAHASGAAIAARPLRARPPYWGRPNTILRYEPT